MFKSLSRMIMMAGLAAFMAQGQSWGQPSKTSSEQDFNPVPKAWKWISDKDVVYSYDGSFTAAPEGTSSIHIEGAVNLTYSPDSSKVAFTRDNDLFVADVATSREQRLTFDGTGLILNGYASWVYYEEILGRPSKYRAFWWSPDSRKIAFYHFDNTDVPMFPIYSPSGQDGKLISTHYPKAGETNPQVKIGIADVSIQAPSIVWADFDPLADQYFGIPFWGADSKALFISREPRLQNTLDLYSVDVRNGAKTHIYHETYPTWLDWIDGMLFSSEGIYMVRSFETQWQQIYFLSYDGKEFRRLTSGRQWGIDLLRVDQKKGTVYFTARRDATVRNTLYSVDGKGQITTLTDPSLDVQNVVFSPDGRHFVCALSNFTTPTQVWKFETGKTRGARKVADMRGPSYDPSRYSLPRLVTMTTEDGLTLPASIVFPSGFDSTRKYPVHVDIYGGPDTPLVKDCWKTPSDDDQWWSNHGIIEVTADCRAAGHNGRLGMDQVYRHLNDLEVKDFVAWADYLKSLPYVEDDKIGVEGFSFGGTMTAMLLLTHPQAYHYGIAGGGVYDWALYDTHYTERFMDTPQANPQGYAKSRVINYVSSYPVRYVSSPDSAKAVEPVMLKLTHGTGDDNVHFQQTLQLIDEMQRQGKKFEFMIYPDAKHGYHGYQKEHSVAADREFWLRYLVGEK